MILNENILFQYKKTILSFIFVWETLHFTGHAAKTKIAALTVTLTL